MNGTANGDTEWTVYDDGRLYMNNHGIQSGHWVPARDIPIADAKWNATYGALDAGPFNTGGCSGCDAGCACQCYWPRQQ